jgi:glycosyltransferase involved in cell wall biosynthesis
MNCPLVSVIMPVYNSSKYLKDAINSILSQSYKNIELVIVNDGSTDLSRDIILSYSDPRIRLFENERNSGIVYSRNKGLQEARGKYIANLDSDDIALPGRIEKQVDFLENHADYGMCGTFFFTMDHNGKLLKKRRFPTDHTKIKTFLILGNCFCNSTVMIRAELAKELKYIEQYYVGEDYELFYRISKITKVANLPFYGTGYREHDSNISNAKLSEMLAIVNKINGQILIDLNIRVSETDMEIHRNFINSNIVFFNNDIRIKELENWLIKFYTIIKSKIGFDHILIYQLITDKWIVITYNAGQYQKLFFNNLFKLNKTFYLIRLIKRIFERVASQIRTLKN